MTAEDIQRTPSVPIEELLTSRFPGVSVTRAPDGGIAIRIRGATSFEGSNAPLFVIDGIAVEPGPNGSLTGIVPNDIETIEVLKDASATAMYGMRGANGVIVIKTKRAGR
ncbi:MAG: TonB-dependent receptor plug domain-containing protein [Gemmatimonadaceae bacterium]|nr:TonB-dependent receptor plug domain-containing protein [Gemmatimonadaceae bacterium]